jgi:uncharacterized membrane protein YoaK (UPF0700 family)
MNNQAHSRRMLINLPINYLARLMARERTAASNLHLGLLLAFIAGALNAGGFLAIGQYTSHMSGLVSAVADNLVLGNVALVIAAVLALASFIAGAATTALLVNYAKRNDAKNIYAVPFMIEAMLLLLFGVIGAKLQSHEIVSISSTAILLCYVMGLQNALITKISNAEIRTTHLTGMVTDIGIELGKLVYWNRDDGVAAHMVLANRTRLKVHALLVVSFFVGGLTGAMGFRHAGFSSTIPLAVPLIAMSMASVFHPRRLNP